MPGWRETADLLCRERFDEHPQLRVLPYEQALIRLRCYRAEARASLGWWVPAVDWGLGGAMLVGIVLDALDSALGVAFLVGLVVAMVATHTHVQRRIRRTVAARIAADFAAGRDAFCLSCGYCLTGVEASACPECGGPVWAVTPEVSTQEVAWREHRRRMTTAMIGLPLCFLPTALLTIVALVMGHEAWWVVLVSVIAGGSAAFVVGVWWLYLRRTAPPRPQ